MRICWHLFIVLWWILYIVISEQCFAPLRVTNTIYNCIATKYISGSIYLPLFSQRAFTRFNYDPNNCLPPPPGKICCIKRRAIQEYLSIADLELLMMLSESIKNYRVSFIFNMFTVFLRCQQSLVAIQCGRKKIQHVSEYFRMKFK